MNELDKYHDQLAGQEIVNLQIPPEQDSEATTDMLAGILRRWYIVLLIFLIVCGIGLPAVWYMVKPLYDVTGAIRVAPILADLLSGEEDRGEISNYDSFMNTEAAKITSNAVVQRVADDMKQKLLGTKTEDPAMKLKRAIVDQGTISVAATRMSELIYITMRSKNEGEAKQIVDSFIKAYMEIEVISSDEDENRQLAILENRRDFLYEKIENDRQTIYQLGQEYGTVALEGRQDMMSVLRIC